MASVSECDLALRSLAARLLDVDPGVRAKFVVERTVSCRVHDLDTTWSGRLCDEGLVDIAMTGAGHDAPAGGKSGGNGGRNGDGKAQVRLTVGSDDLVALVEGRLALPAAVATGKVRVQASPFDLLRLSAFL